MEVRRHAVGVATWRYGCLEVWWRAVGVETWRHGGIVALEARYRYCDVEAWRYDAPGARDTCSDWRYRGHILFAFGAWTTIAKAVDS